MTHRALAPSAVLAAVVWASGAAAMYTPNPAGRWDPNHFFLAGDFQFNSSKDLDVDHSHTSVDNMAGFFVRPSYSIARNVVLYGRLGFQGADHVDTGFAGGFGVQGAYVLPRARAWAIGASFDYLHWSSDFSHSDTNIDWNEFQFAPAVSYRIPTVPTLTPYAGMLFDFVDAHDGISERDPVGLLLGLNFDPTREVRLDFQFRAVTETGFLLSAGYRF